MYRVAVIGNIDLFEKRIAIFNETWEAASSTHVTSEPIMPKPSFTNLFPQASFLFGPEVEQYMKELGSNMVKLATIRQSTKANSSVVPADRISEQLELENWISNAAIKGIREKFSPYLNF